jgi:hypothetical protein
LIPTTAAASVGRHLLGQTLPLHLSLFVPSKVKFQATPVPKAVHEQRLRAMQSELEGRRAETRARIAAARAKAKEGAAAIDEQRRRAADEAYRKRLQEDRLRTVDSVGWGECTTLEKGST